MRRLTLYHGTSRGSADRLMRQGWALHGAPAGGQRGRPSLLYLTTDPENARWYADQKEDGVVLEVRLSIEDLVVDPEDGISETVEAELALGHGLPGNLAAFRPLPADAFSRWHPNRRPGPGGRSP